MVFRLRYPRWGSQALLVTQGLAGYLDYLEWDISIAETRLFDYLERQGHLLPASLKALRLTQIRHLTELNDPSHPITLHPADPSDMWQVGLVQLAQQGYLLSELLTDAVNDLDPDTYSRLMPLLKGLTLHEYIDALREDQRELHPNVLHQRVTEYMSKTGAVANNYSPFTDATQVTPAWPSPGTGSSMRA